MLLLRKQCAAHNVPMRGNFYCIEDRGKKEEEDKIRTSENVEVGRRRDLLCEHIQELAQNRKWKGRRIFIRKDSVSRS